MAIQQMYSYCYFAFPFSSLSLSLSLSILTYNLNIYLTLFMMIPTTEDGRSTVVVICQWDGTNCIEASTPVIVLEDALIAHVKIIAYPPLSITAENVYTFLIRRSKLWGNCL